ncbi:unnamed protein product [Hyaloperonospora brassicae]|uniref:Uncharacterized protein n=1 Tax=Hyaloperonospora brassicae TaxID=162125 RepID=A0AAV0U7Z8_HYABA|nr:unnamed protein product [Hyaloperonospora brassicae]
MPRPILKTLSSYASPLRPSGSTPKKEQKRASARRSLDVSRHVTFSPFTKLRGDPPTDLGAPSHTDGQKTMGSLASGFTFSSATQVERQRQLRQKEKLQTMQMLYNAAKRRPRSIKSLLLKNVPGLECVYNKVSEWLDYVRVVRESMPWLERPRPKRRPRRRRRLLRGLSPASNNANRRRLQQQQQRPQYSIVTTHPILLPPVFMPSRGNSGKPPAIVYSSPQPDLTPANRGSFANLLRRKGIPVDEDERQAKRAIDEDLLGVRQVSKRRRTR